MDTTGFNLYAGIVLLVVGFGYLILMFTGAYSGIEPALISGRLPTQKVPRAEPRAEPQPPLEA